MADMFGGYSRISRNDLERSKFVNTILHNQKSSYTSIDDDEIIEDEGDESSIDDDRNDVCEDNTTSTFAKKRKDYLKKIRK